ncbi:hypothetical protein AXF42_Ash012678 [Apostasia shenzhenica]|uniref:Uncharacterized protein n=1 Tax=Apostasia shenzhenica TaxID=1088818 RepID=A0A2H9ZTC5_9ASPA|nr:hypothetical protein AXF42_Ash012678 [Apostasia shenzhenica]
MGLFGGKTILDFARAGPNQSESREKKQDFRVQSPNRPYLPQKRSRDFFACARAPSAAVAFFRGRRLLPRPSPSSAAVAFFNGRRLLPRSSPSSAAVAFFRGRRLIPSPSSSQVVVAFFRDREIYYRALGLLLPRPSPCFAAAASAHLVETPEAHVFKAELPPSPLHICWLLWNLFGLLFFYGYAGFHSWG